MNSQPAQAVDLLGAITANVYFVMIIAMFAARIVGRLELGQWIGLVSILTMIPLAYLFVVGLKADRPFIYFLWIGLMLLFLLFELTVDHILKLDFRSVRWAVIPYVMFFFGATGGMIGLAAQAGRSWAVATTLIFFVMAAMAFIQRAKTGL
ncbi:MAG: hypothetical protein QF713_04895 [Dehalococcoidales bacterium]|nr:hypothetical protein [Dehalococcoidales bacterium]